MLIRAYWRSVGASAWTASQNSPVVGRLPQPQQLPRRRRKTAALLRPVLAGSMSGQSSAEAAAGAGSALQQRAGRSSAVRQRLRNVSRRLRSSMAQRVRAASEEPL